MRRGGIRTRRGSRPLSNRQTERVESTRTERHFAVMISAFAIAIAGIVLVALDRIPEAHALGLTLITFSAGMTYAALILRRP